MPAATRTVLIEAPVDKVFAIVTDYQRYPEFLPEVKRVSTSERSANQVQVNYEVDVVKRIKYSLRMQEQPPHRVNWSFVQGEVMKDNHGSWLLEPAGKGKTQATYTIEMALGPLVPKAIVKALVEGSLPKMLDAFKRRAESS